MDLFCDRTAIDTSLARFFNENDMQEYLMYSDCLKLNDENTKWNEQVDESHNFFIPFEDGDNIE